MTSFMILFLNETVVVKMREQDRLFRGKESVALNSAAVASSSMMDGFIDGFLDGSLINPHVMSGSNEDLHIGHHGAWNKYFTGLLDEVRIYDRALSAAEVQALYNLGQ